MHHDDHHNQIVHSAIACIHCGLCLPQCPTYRETGNEAASPRGRIYMIRAMAEGRLTPGEAAIEHLDSCVGCRACETACPAGVSYGHLLERARAIYVEPNRPAGLRTRVMRPLLRQVLPDRQKLKAAALPGRLAQRLLVKAGKAPGWLPEAMRRPLELLPESAPAPTLPEWTEAIGKEKGVVAFLQGCAMPALYPKANQATVKMLALAGLRVWVPPDLGCCGAVLAHDGDWEGAQAQARRNLAALAGTEVAAVVSNAGGCGAALAGYGAMLADDPQWAEQAAVVAAKVQDFSQVLARYGLPVAKRAIEATVTYHDPCHLAHGLKVREEPRALIQDIPGVTYVPLVEADWCCGGAGSYTLTQPDLSDQMLGHKLRHLEETGAEIVVTANPPCLMQIGMGLRKAGREVRLVHLAELLAETYGVSD